MRKIIGISGAHGTGKTTSVFGLLAKLKKQTKVEIGWITEISRSSPFPIVSSDAKKSSEETQLWIFCEQFRREIETVDKYKIVVSDRTLIDNLAYSCVLGYHKNLKNQIKLIKEHCQKNYMRVIFKKIKDNPYLVSDNVRNTDPKFAYEVENAMLDLYDELQIPILFARHKNIWNSLDLPTQQWVWDTNKF